MGWSIGFDKTWGRDVGYGVPALCDHPACGALIDRGLSHVCMSQQPFGGAGCGLYFCHVHLTGRGCLACSEGAEPFEPTKDVEEWIRHKLEHDSWGRWREENAEEVEELRGKLP